MGTLLTRESLALHGGKPVRGSLLPYGRQSIDEADIQAVVDVLRSDWLTTGPKVAEFEEAFAAYVGARFAVSFSSGTAALHGAAFAAGIGAGDEVITTPLTFAATANCILYQGGTPVFADISPDTLNLDPACMAAAITSRTKAVIPVDYAGHPADLDSILATAHQHGLVVIEDACHALGAEHGGRKVGSLSDMTVFSFHPVKHLTTGEGGMVTTNDRSFAETLRKFRNHGITTGARERQDAGQWHYEMALLGYNYRLTDISCALGLSQLPRLDRNLKRRRQIAARYSSALRHAPGIISPSVRQNVLPAWHLYPIRLDASKLVASRDEILRALRAENIGVNVHYVPVHLHPYYRGRFGYRGGEFPVAEAAYETLISLPMFHGMQDGDVNDVVDAVGKVLAYFAVTRSKGAQGRLRTVAIVQARMGSTRLPGKVLMDLGGASVLQRVVCRLRRARRIDEVVVATTELPKDGVIEELCRHMNVACFRGSEDDVLDRYVRAAEQFQAEAVVRITADCPVVDPYWVDEVIRALEEEQADFACNDTSRTLPRGLDVEAFTFAALRKAEAISDQFHQREHVTRIFYERPDLFRRVCLKGQDGWAKYRLTLDTPEDLELLRAIYSNFKNRDDFNWREALALLQRSPELARINALVVQKPVPSTASVL